MFKNASVKKTLAKLCLITLITPAQFSAAGDGQSVEIIGQRDCSGILSEKCGWGDFGNGNGGDGGTGNIDPGREPGEFGGGGSDENVEVAALVKATKKQKDVRCAPGVSGQTQGTTSYADDIVRKLAAADIQNKINASDWIRAVILRDIVGFFKKSNGKDAVTITYADGGTEDWYVTSYYSSIAVSEPVSGSLVFGSGKIESSASCPKFG
jgi:hypothetical protein